MWGEFLTAAPTLVPCSATTSAFYLALSYLLSGEQEGPYPVRLSLRLPVSSMRHRFPDNRWTDRSSTDLPLPTMRRICCVATVGGPFAAWSRPPKNPHMITLQRLPSSLCIVIDGRLDTTGSAEFDRLVRPALVAERFAIVDFSACAYLSSTGIRSLLLSAKQLNGRGGRLLLACVRPEVAQVLEMAGLRESLNLRETVAEAQTEICQLARNTGSSVELAWNGATVQWRWLEDQREPARFWRGTDIAGYDELGFAIGIGAVAENTDCINAPKGCFVATGRCAGFVFPGSDYTADFRVTNVPRQAGILFSQAWTVGTRPDACMRWAKPVEISLCEVQHMLADLPAQLATSSRITGGILLDQNPASVSLVMFPIANSLAALHGSPEVEATNGLCGIVFKLERAPECGSSAALDEFLEKALTLENIVAVAPLDESAMIVNPVFWLFAADKAHPADATRRRVTGDAEFAAAPHKAFLARRLYSDSARVEVKTLHGGYTAQTYQVTSYDSAGRRLRPTVLKLANRAMIARESERCRKYAMPYIFNNSASVLGTEFMGDVGALRYNFVGIGGEQSQLRWLRHHFENWPLEKLEPLFDKIFLQILQPWYGQSVQQAITPFLDHDPTRTFFPHLAATAETVLRTTADKPEIELPELGRWIVNPYWFLSYEYPRHYGMALEYPTAICHGDLNMQNILVDDVDNVYLIDFSETRQRSAVSDFARLEAIFLIECTPVRDEAEYQDRVRLLERFYNGDGLDRPPTIPDGLDPTTQRCVQLALRMRRYALQCVHSDPNPLPYYLALLEWILPIVCYGSSSVLWPKKLSQTASALLCEQVQAGFPKRSAP